MLCLWTRLSYFRHILHSIRWSRMSVRRFNSTFFFKNDINLFETIFIASQFFEQKILKVKFWRVTWICMVAMNEVTSLSTSNFSLNLTFNDSLLNNTTAFIGPNWTFNGRFTLFVVISSFITTSSVILVFISKRSLLTPFTIYVLYLLLINQPSGLHILLLFQFYWRAVCN